MGKQRKRGTPEDKIIQMQLLKKTNKSDQFINNSMIILLNLNKSTIYLFKFVDPFIFLIVLLFITDFSDFNAYLYCM